MLLTVSSRASAASRGTRWQKRSGSFLRLASLARDETGVCANLYGMRTTLLAVVAAAALTPAIIAAPRINFTRTLPPLHDIGTDHSAVIYALGDNDKVTTFVDVFLTHTNRAANLRLDDALDRSRNLIGERPSEKTIRQLNREHPAGVYLGINQFSCNAETRG